MATANPTEIQTMIPQLARDLLNLHLTIARTTVLDKSAEDALANVTAMLGYAVAVNHLTPAEYGSELVMVKLVRAQRANTHRQE